MLAATALLWLVTLVLLISTGSTLLVLGLAYLSFGSLYGAGLSLDLVYADGIDQGNVLGMWLWQTLAWPGFLVHHVSTMVRRLRAK